MSVRAKAAPVAPKAAAGGAAADSRTAAPAPATKVRVPSLVGHGISDLDSVTAAHGLKWAELEGNRCPHVPGIRVTRQVPRAGAMVVSGSTVRVTFGTCVRYGSGS